MFLALVDALFVGRGGWSFQSLPIDEVKLLRDNSMLSLAVNKDDDNYPEVGVVLLSSVIIAFTALCNDQQALSLLSPPRHSQLL
jgi:hypothetical protein